MKLDLQQLREIRKSLNELINQRWIYINLSTTSEEEKDVTKDNLVITYNTLSTILQLIGKEGSK